MTIPPPDPNEQDYEDPGGLRPLGGRLSTKLISGVLAILGVSLLLSSLRSIAMEEQILDAQIERMGKTLSEAVERMRRAHASGPEEALEEGVAIAVEVIEAARPLVQGFHLSAPRREVEVALRVLKEAGVRVTPQ